MNKLTQSKPSKTLEKIYWKLLRYSPVFKYIYRRLCYEAFYDLERSDIKTERKMAMDKWRDKVKRNLGEDL